MDAQTDALTWLPDELRAKILSLLPTKQAASTSVLSKNWRYVSRLVLDNLDFDDSVLLNKKQVRYMFPESFKDFVDQTLALQCNYPIKKFSLKCRVATNNIRRQNACVGRWISNVVERGVLELELRIKDQDVQCLPPQLFASKTLVKLSLGLITLGKLPSYVLLPSLKSLFIDNILFKKTDLCSVLLSGCPVLEEFSLVLMKGLPMPNTISSSSIKRLSVHCGYRFGCSEVSLDLPNLVYLDYSHFGLCEYSLVNLESLIEAKLDLYLRCVLRQGVKNLIMGIRNVEILHLSPASVDGIHCSCEKGLIILPVFNNLVNLSFGSCNEICWDVLADLLKKSPKLECLTIKDLNDYTDKIPMPLNKVKVLHVLGYCGTNKELKQLKNFLRGFKCIELVQVDVEGKDDGILLQATKDLMMLPAGRSLSSKCHVKVTPLK